MELSDSGDRVIYRIIRWGTPAIVLLWIISAIVILNVFPLPSEHGSFGDLFGAINALFSGFAFLGVVVAILLQRQELREQRIEIRRSREAQQQSANALAEQLDAAQFRARLESLNLLIEAHRKLLDDTGARPLTVRVNQERRMLELAVREYEADLRATVDDWLLRARGEGHA